MSADLARQNRLVTLGWTVLRFTWEQVVRRPGDVAATLRSVLGA
jgi:very-short-patch-repair endonuclease